MLGKLLKYDLKWVYKVVGIFYILAFIFSVIGRILSNIENSLVFSVTSQIAFGFAISMMASSLINCLMRLWARVIKNLYKDESYLTHTLPIPKKTIYASKFLAAFISILTTVFVIIICLAICYYSESNIELLKNLLELAASTYNTTVINLLLLISIVIFLEIMFIVLIGFVGIILGHKSNKSKMIKTLVISFILYMVSQAITIIMIYVLGLINPDIMNLINTTQSLDINALKSVMYIAIFIYAAYIILLYILGQKQLEKGVNVE